MKKLLASILGIAMVLGTMGISVFADATIHNVANDTEFAEAISKANDGDTIKLAAGTYEGGISIGKNITIEGSIDEDGNPITIFSGDNGGSYYAYSIYMNKGTIKNIKIIDAWKGIMTEGNGSLTIDNVTMVNIMYGVHIAEAKGAEDIVTIQNCNMDIAWANSFAGGSYSIVIKNNVFTTSDPYYDVAYVVNTYAPNTSVSENAFCENTRIDVRTEAVAESINIGNNYYEDGPTSVLEGSTCQVTITTCYADAEMTKVVSGTFKGGMVNIDNPERTFITTEITDLNANESIKIEIYDANDVLLATTTATEKTISAKLTNTTPFTGINSTDEEWWITDWEDGKLRADYVPAYGTLYVDGIEMNSAPIKMRKASGEQEIVWGEVPGVAPAISELPEATVEKLGAITVPANGYSVYPSGINTEPMDLQIAMEFISQDTPEEAAENAYADYVTDFFIEIDGLKDGSFTADGCYLAGHYGSYGWVKVPLDGMTVEGGKVYPVLSSVTQSNFWFTYEGICTNVKDFKCGIYLTEAVLEQNPDITVTLSLGLSETSADAVNAKFIEVDAVTYNKADFVTESEPVLFENIVFVWNMDIKEDNGVKYYPLHVYAGIDSLAYKEVGFKMTAKNDANPNGLPQTKSTTIVYDSMKVTNSKGEEKIYYPSDVGGKYIYGQELLFTVGNWFNKDTSVSITPYAIKLDDTVIDGETKTFSDEIIKSRFPESQLFQEVSENEN